MTCAFVLQATGVTIGMLIVVMGSSLVKTPWGHAQGQYMVFVGSLGFFFCIIFLCDTFRDIAKTYYLFMSEVDRDAMKRAKNSAKKEKT
jgi:hypothetical protein